MSLGAPQSSVNTGGRALNTENNLREDSVVSLGVASAGILSASAAQSQANATFNTGSSTKKVGHSRVTKLRISPFSKEVASSTFNSTAKRETLLSPASLSGNFLNKNNGVSLMKVYKPPSMTKGLVSTSNKKSSILSQSSNNTSASKPPRWTQTTDFLVAKKDSALSSALSKQPGNFGH